MLPAVRNIQSRTEATAHVWADVTGAQLVYVETRMFAPERITVTYDWRIQLGDTAWKARSVTLAGPWVTADGTPTGTGTGNVTLPIAHAPEWMQEFAADNRPTTALIERE